MQGDGVSNKVKLHNSLDHTLLQNLKITRRPDVYAQAS